MTCRRNQTIDVLRFLFAVIIVIHHSRSLVGDDNSLFLGGSLAVEFYFLVSGYLMMASVYRRNQQGLSGSLAEETFSFLKRKLKSFYPEVMVAWGAAFLFTCSAGGENLKEVAKHFLNAFPESLLMLSFGMSSSNVNPATWYLSSMLIFMVVLYPLLRKYPAVMKYLVMPLSSLFLLGWLCMEYNHPRDPTKWLGWTYKGNLRALAELELGALCFFASQKIRDIPFNRLARMLLAVMECGCYGVSILYMFFETPSRMDIFFIALLCIGICLSFSGQTALSSLPEKRIIFWLGKYSFPLYLSHQFYAKHLNDILPVFFTNNQRMMVYLLCSFLTALAVWGISALLRKNSGRILQAGKRLFVEKEALNV